MFPKPVRGSVGCHGKFTRPQQRSKCALWQTFLLTFFHPEVWSEVPLSLHYCMVRSLGIGTVNRSRLPRVQDVLGYPHCHAHRGWNSYHTRAIALWQHICLIFLAHLPWPVSVTIMCERVCVLCLSAWLSVCVVGCLFLVNIPCFFFMFQVVTHPVVGPTEI